MRTVPTVIVGLGVLAAPVAILAPRLGIDRSAGWGEARSQIRIIAMPTILGGAAMVRVLGRLRRDAPLRRLSLLLDGLLGTSRSLVSILLGISTNTVRLHPIPRTQRP